MVHVRDIMSTLGGCLVHRGDIMRTLGIPRVHLGGVQYIGGYQDTCGGDNMSTLEWFYQ